MSDIYYTGPVASALCLKLSNAAGGRDAELAGGALAVTMAAVCCAMHHPESGLDLFCSIARTALRQMVGITEDDSDPADVT